MCKLFVLAKNTSHANKSLENLHKICKYNCKTYTIPEPLDIK